MKSTCGIFIVDKKNRILVGHPTEVYKPFCWSIPKGEQDPGESTAQTAVREVFEETGIRVDPSQIEYLWNSVYATNRKTLHAYIVKLDVDGETLNAHCDSMFQNRAGKMIPEIDEFRWVTLEEAEKICHESQIRLLPLVAKKISTWNG
jgi:8-oxo-dGTP pyrophosphatase MutT (NUDIX family)